MALPARAPKPPDQVRHRMGSSTALVWKDVERVPYLGESPDLPARESGRPYPVSTLRWWEIVRKMPHCILWEASDWEYALAVAEMHASVFERDLSARGAVTLLGTFRTAENKLGTTLSSRLSLRIRYVDPVSKQTLPDNVARLHDYSELYAE